MIVHLIIHVLTVQHQLHEHDYDTDYRYISLQQQSCIEVDYVQV
ncbi:unnamed protein product [Schistosoma mattheei]|uniref:Uncharacterized protein n=1 Tax=Schistosoma mattheei TaxID=31246 RepID=A0A183Q131_9TREM|nr:unnamed protein product [Schistosoma mattheei]